MKTPQEALAEEIADMMGLLPDGTRRKAIYKTIAKHFPPPSEDGVEEISEKYFRGKSFTEQERIEFEQAILANRQARESKSCVWKYDDFDDAWDTGCDNKFQFTNDGPKENNFEFCPHCGGRLITKTKGTK